MNHFAILKNMILKMFFSSFMTNLERKKFKILTEKKFLKNIEKIFFYLLFYRNNIKEEKKISEKYFFYYF